MAIGAGILILQLLFLMKVKFTAWPEMIAWPFLITEGWLPYQDIAIAHTPILILLLSGFYKLFGVGIIQLKIFTWIWILISNLLLYWVVNKIWNKRVALYSLIAFTILLLFYDGNGLWFDLGLIPFALALYYLIKTKMFFKAGIVFGLGFLTKQTFIWFLIPVVLSSLKKKKLIGYKPFIVAGLIVFLSFVLLLALFGIMPDFYNWAVNFGIFTLPKAAGQIQLPDLKNLIISVFPFSIFIPLLLKRKKQYMDLIAWAIAGSLGAYPRFEYFHFLPALPFAAIAAGIVFSEKRKNKLTNAFIIFYLLSALFILASFFIKNYEEGTRFYEGEVAEIVNYTQNNTTNSDRIFVMNWWDNVYGLSGRLPATKPLVPQLSWYQEAGSIQDKEIESLKSSPPKLIILKNYTQTGLSSYIPTKLYNYVKQNYKLKEKVGGFEILISK